MNGEYHRLSLVSTITRSMVLVWTGVFGGILLLQWGDPFGWLALAVGVALLVLPFSTRYRMMWTRGKSERYLPITTFTSVALLILMFGAITFVYLSDPFVFYNEQDKMTVILMGGATLLSLAALAANIIAYRLDRKPRPLS